MSIGELADAAGLSRRAVRFYVMRKLLAPPLGRGRGGHYTTTHLQQLQRIQALQQAGHSLDAIARIISGATVPAPPSNGKQRRRVRPMPGIEASLWTHVRMAEGIVLQFDATRHRLTAEQLLALRQLAQHILTCNEGPGTHPAQSDRPHPQRQGGSL